MPLATPARPVRRWSVVVVVVAAAAVGSFVVGLADQDGTASTIRPATVEASGTSRQDPLPGPDGPAFFVPPALPGGARPGDVVWFRDVLAVATTGIDVPGASAFQLLYVSTNAVGQRVAVSGTVVVPPSVSAATPLVGLASGTQGLGDSCATSSRGLSFAPQYDGALVAGMLRRGWAVAATDYEGLATPGTHTFGVGRSAGPALVDVVRAALALPAAGLGADTLVGFAGYGEGGSAAAWAGELAATYAPELAVVGIAAGAVPADLVRVGRALDGQLGFVFLAYAAIGFDAAYSELDLASYLNDQGRAELAHGLDQCLASSFAEQAYHSTADYTTTDPMRTPAWHARLAENRLGATPPGLPVLLYQGLFDEFVPFDQAAALRDTYCAHGVPVTWRGVRGSHVATAAVGVQLTTDFLAARFARRPATTTC